MCLQEVNMLSASNLIHCSMPGYRVTMKWVHWEMLLGFKVMLHIRSQLWSVTIKLCTIHFLDASTCLNLLWALDLFSYDLLLKHVMSCVRSPGIQNIVVSLCRLEVLAYSKVLIAFSACENVEIVGLLLNVSAFPTVKNSDLLWWVLWFKCQGGNWSK